MDHKIAHTIIELRKSHELSQAQLAELMGLNKNVMGRIEHGTRPLRAEEIVKLAEIFNVSTDFILGQKQEQPLVGEEKYQLHQQQMNKDLAKKIKDLINLTENEPDLNFDGLPLTKENRQLLANALEIGLHLSQKKQAEQQKIDDKKL